MYKPQNNKIKCECGKDMSYEYTIETVSGVDVYVCSVCKTIIETTNAWEKPTTKERLSNHEIACMRCKKQMSFSGNVQDKQKTEKSLKDIYECSCGHTTQVVYL